MMQSGLKIWAQVFMGANRDYIDSWDAEKVRQKYAAEFEDDRVRHGEPKEEDREPPGTVVEEFSEWHTPPIQCVLVGCGLDNGLYMHGGS